MNDLERAFTDYLPIQNTDLVLMDQKSDIFGGGDGQTLEMAVPIQNEESVPDNIPKWKIKPVNDL